MENATPMMKQYFKIKENYEEHILFFRVGDFYEMFYNDALVASKELNIVLTSKGGKQTDPSSVKTPMCGIPFHSADTYIARLIKKGFKVAICEQVDTSTDEFGVMKRDVVRVITPGTVIDENILESGKNNYILSIYLKNGSGFGVSVCDISTGEFSTTEFPSIKDNQRLFDEIVRIKPAEIICNSDFYNHYLSQKVRNELFYFLNDVDVRMFEIETATDTLCKHFNINNLSSFGLDKKELATSASGGLLWYISYTQKGRINQVSSLKYYEVTDFMILDASSRKNLELTETIRDKKIKGSLLAVIDETGTAMGARLLRKWVEQPLLNSDEINKRLGAVEELINDFMLREELIENLNNIKDFERILSRISYKNASERDLINLKNSIENLPEMKKVLRTCKSKYLVEIYNQLDELKDIFTIIDDAIVDDTYMSVLDGQIIKDGYNEELDIVLRTKNKATELISNLENKEREKTGIKTLKVSVNNVFGYYIQVSTANVSKVPDYYIRRQTLTNSERYITNELKDLEELIFGADEKIAEFEKEIFNEILENINNNMARIQYLAYTISLIDTLQSLAVIAEKMNYSKPIVDDGEKIIITKGRHPVVEKNMNNQFIANDSNFDDEENRLAIITGPNMAGKSTYMRQNAIIVLMAQIGSFVPADFAHIGIVDRIFTRVGASDDLSSGQSTFMVEMAEVANILHNATNKSLVILDEIGRGTSTFDGLSIAWAVLEYIVDKKKIGSKTLFATHYHELSELEGKIDGVKNYCIDVKESGDDIIFLRNIKRGGANNSYGIQVAKLAGLPEKVIERSNEILKELQSVDIAKNSNTNSKNNSDDILNSNEREILEELEKLDIMSMSPIESHELLMKYCELLKNK